MYKTISNLVFFLILSLSLWANNSGFRQITNRDGLTQNDVLCVYQDSRGFKWFGTNDGLSRYDGIDFKNYRRGKEGISSGIISGIIEDHHENLWVATIDNGINKINLQTGEIEQFFQFGENGKSLLSNEINSIACDGDGIVYYATNKGIGKIVDHNGYSQVVNFSDDKNLTNFYRGAKIFVDKQSRLWLMAGRNLHYYKNDKLELFLQTSEGLIRDMVESKDKFIIGTSTGAFFVNKNMSVPDNPKFFSSNPLNDLIVDENEVVWVGTNTGVVRYSYSFTKQNYQVDETFDREKFSVIQNINVRTFFLDQTGILYIGTNGSGVFKYNSNEKKFRHYEVNNGSGGNKVRAIFQDSKKNIYIGKEEGKLLILPSASSKNYEKGFVPCRNSETAREINQPIFAFAEVEYPKGEKYVLAGSDFNFPILNLSAKKIEIPDFKGRIFSIAQGANGLIWIGTYDQGLYRFDPSGKLPLKLFTTDIANGSLLSNIIRSLYFDSKNRLWIGTAKGLNVLISDDQKDDFPNFISIVNNLEDPKSLSYNYVLPVFESETGDIWIGTMGGGLNRLIQFDRKGNAEFDIYTTAHGLPNNVIKSILEDGLGNLWISTNRGLSRFKPTEKSFENFDLNDGLQDFEFSELAACKLQDGELLFGGVNGFNAFYPNEIVRDTTSAKPVFTNLTVLNKDVNVGEVLRNRVLLKKDINCIERINLKYSENSFAIQFASLHFSHPEKNKCKYKLIGFDNDWVVASTGDVAKYTNLKPGKYTLELKAANSDGIWSNTTKSIGIIVSPPFFLTWPMKILYFALIILVFLFFRKFTIITANRKHDLLIKEIEKQKEQEINQVKFQFFTNISHEFKTPLTLIINPLEQLLKTRELTPEKDLRNSHLIMFRNARLLLRLINQLMDFRKIDQGKMKLKVNECNLKDFLAEIHESFSSLAASKNIKFNFITHTFDENIWLDQDILEKVIYNILSNAFKFTESGGKVNLELIDDNSEFMTIIIADSGIGIPEKAQSNIFERFFQIPFVNAKIQPGTGIGLSYSKSLIELMHGKIEFKSREGEGTTFFVKIPKNKEIYSQEEILEDQKLDSSLGQDYLFNEDSFEVRTIKNSQVENEELCTLLLVEDNNDLRNFLKEYFSSSYNVLEARNGKEAIDLCLDHYPDIIITDLAMPIMDGVVMTQNIKDMSELSHIPIIMLTAQTSEEQQKVGLEIGADAYFSKPFNVEILASQVLSLLKNRQRLRAKYREKVNIVPSEISPSRKDEKFINKLLEIIEKNISDPDLSVQKLAVECGFSQTSLNKKLIALTDQKAKVFIRSIRLKRAAQLIKQGDLSISEIAYSLGFNDLQYFRKCFNAEFGCLPSEYKSIKE